MNNASLTVGKTIVQNPKALLLKFTALLALFLAGIVERYTSLCTWLAYYIEKMSTDTYEQHDNDVRGSQALA